VELPGREALVVGAEALFERQSLLLTFRNAPVERKLLRQFKIFLAARSSREGASQKYFEFVLKVSQACWQAEYPIARGVLRQNVDEKFRLTPSSTEFCFT